jgi:hypothetical protein
MSGFFQENISTARRGVRPMREVIHTIISMHCQLLQFVFVVFAKIIGVLSEALSA